jgi:hypothetical protein
VSSFPASNRMVPSMSYLTAPPRSASRAVLGRAAQSVRLPPRPDAGRPGNTGPWRALARYITTNADPVDVRYRSV